MSEFRCDAVTSAIDLPVDHEPGADPGPDREDDRVVTTRGSAEPPFGDCGGVGVVFGEDRDPDAAGHLLGDRRLAPGQMRREPDDAAIRRQETGDREPDGFGVPARGQLADEPVADALLKRIATDENLHMIFYRNICGAGFDISPDQTLRAVTDTLRGEEPDLRVTSIHPGRVDTDMQRAIVAHEGGTYDPGAYLSADSVATAVRHALESTPDAHPTEVVLRPRHR